MRGSWKSEGALNGADAKPVLLIAKGLLKLVPCGVGGGEHQGVPFVGC